MKKIGVLSDTHGFADDRILSFFRDVDEIWHAGDIGNTATALRFSSLKPFRAVYGNIDGAELRKCYPGFQRYTCEKQEIWMIHQGGWPGHYSQEIRKLLATGSPNILITGHSHILKVIYDKARGFLFINPGAAGNEGIHQVKTALRICISPSRISDLEILELPRA